jgi:hypothetical protein
MPKVVVYLRDQEHDALHKLAQREYRATKAQAAVLIRTELERLGVLTPVPQSDLGTNGMMHLPSKESCQEDAS